MSAWLAERSHSASSGLKVQIIEIYSFLLFDFSTFFGEFFNAREKKIPGVQCHHAFESFLRVFQRGREGDPGCPVSLWPGR